MIFLLLLSLSNAWARRAPPPTLTPIVQQGFSYSVEVGGDERHFVSYLVCRRLRGKVEQWRAPLYRIHYRADVKYDVQQVYVSSLKLDGETIVAQSERGQTYRVELSTGQTPRPFLISGFDDVLRQAENTGLIRAALKLFEPDRTFAGMRELYTLISTQEGEPRFVLVSAIATWFERRISDFLLETRYPSAELRLRNWLTQFSIENFKMAQVAQVIAARPGRRFIVVFDNSAASLQLAQRLMSEYPDTVQAVYLREVEKKTHPYGSVVFHTAFDIALNEVRERRLSEKEAVVVGYALLEERDSEKLIPHYAFCPKDYAPCADAQGDMIKICRLVEEKVRAICAQR